VRKGARSRKDTDEPDDDRRWFVLQALGWSRKDAVAFSVAMVAAIAILVNGLWFQTGRHPAPMFKGSLMAAAPAAKNAPPAARPTAPAAAAPAPPPAQAAAKSDSKTDPKPDPKTDPKTEGKSNCKAETPAPARPAIEVVTDIQRELTRRGFYDGAVDGRYGPRTDAAIRDFEQAAGLKGSTEPNEALLAAIKRSNARPKGSQGTPGTQGTVGAVPRPPAPIRSDPINEALAHSKRVLAVQRALAEYGYGQIKPTGVLDAETKGAIEKFERERKLPITGQVSDRVTRELAAITGRPLD
jgi:peptidoglycan hydrolase-like protein with peptidoglycan-binding domain